MVVAGQAPFDLQRLVTVKLADEQWKHGLGPDMPTVRIGAAG